MADFAYTTVPGKIKPLLAKIREVGVPNKATQAWLKSVGYRSSADPTLIGVLKQIGFVDASGVPTSRWAAYRGADHKKVLGAAIRQGYADLFAVYPNAPDRSATDLEHVFSTSSSAGRQVIGKTVSSFRTLCEQAEFGPVSEQTDLTLTTGPVHSPLTSTAPAPASRTPAQSQSPQSPSVHIDIQVHISPEATATQIDQVFKSMAKHLYGVKDTE